MTELLESGFRPARSSLSIAYLVGMEKPASREPSQSMDNDRSNETSKNPSPAPESRIADPSQQSAAPDQAARPSVTPPPQTSASFRPVNEAPLKKPPPKKLKPSTTERSLAPLAPAPPKPHPNPGPRQLAPQPGTLKFSGKTLYDIPAEIRVEIYKLVLADVTVHILPTESITERQAPHALTRVSKVVRNEALPIVHSNCAIEAMVTDFDFSGMLEFMARIPPQDMKALMKNDRLKIQLCTTGEKSKGSQQAVSDSGSLRRWLQYRADEHKLQPKWEYTGIWPGRKVESDIRRRIKRMTEEGKKQELIKLATSIGLQRLEGTPKP